MSKTKYMTVQNIWELKSVNTNIDLNKNELHIWRAKISDNIDKLANYWHLLSQDEQLRANEFYFSKDKNRYIIARAILKKLIANYIGSVPQSILLSYNSYGKPYLLINNYIHELKFNLAHSKDCIVYGFTKNIDIGIDIEFIDTNLITDNLVTYFCSDEEKDTLLKLCHQQKYHYFYELWVLKEAFIKALGLGFSYDITKININLIRSDLTKVNTLNNDQTILTLKTFLSYPGYYSAFAINSHIAKVDFLSYQD